MFGRDKRGETGAGDETKSKGKADPDKKRAADKAAEESREDDKTSLAEVRLSAKDLFGLVGSPDACGLAVDDALLERALRDPDSLARWRRRAVRKLARADLAERDGALSEEVEHALAPLRGPGVALLNGRTNVPRNQGGASFELCVRDGQATAIFSPEGRRDGSWSLIDFGPREQWEGKFGALIPFGVKFRRSRFDQHVVVLGDNGLDYLSALELGDTAFLHEFARARHVSQEPLVDMAHQMQVAMGARPIRMSRFFCYDATGCETEHVGGIDTRRVTAGFLREKEMRVYPTLGCVLSLVRSPRPGAKPEDWETPEGRDASTFGRIDFVAAGGILDVLLAIDEYPTEEPNGRQARRRGKRRGKG